MRVLRKILLFIFCVGLIAGLLYLYERCQLRTVFIEAETGSLPQIETIFTSQLNLIWLSPKQLSRKLQIKYPYIDDVVVSRKFPDMLIVQLRFKAPTARLIREQKSIYFDEKGASLPPLLTFDKFQVPTIVCHDDVSSQFIVAVIVESKKIGFEVPQESSCRANHEVLLKFVGYDVLTRDNTAPENIVASLQYLQKQFRIEGSQPKRIDARFEKPVLIFDLAQIASQDAAIVPQ